MLLVIPVSGLLRGKNNDDTAPLLIDSQDLSVIIENCLEVLVKDVPAGTLDY